MKDKSRIDTFFVGICIIAFVFVIIGIYKCLSTQKTLYQYSIYIAKPLTPKDSIVKLDNEKLGMKVEYVEKYLNSRLDDLRNYMVALTTLLLIISAVSYFKSKHTARETAEDEFDKKFKTYHDKIIETEASATELLNKIKTAAEVAKTLDSEKALAGLLERAIKMNDKK